MPKKNTKDAEREKTKREILDAVGRRRKAKKSFSGDSNIERYTRNAPFIEITDAERRYHWFIDYRRIVSVRDPSYDNEIPYGAVIVVDGIQSPINVDDKLDAILGMNLAAQAKAPAPIGTGTATSFIPLTLTDGDPIYVDYRRIIAVRPTGDEETRVFVDGYSNIDPEDGDIDYSFIVSDSWQEILTAIREAERRMAGLDAEPQVPRKRDKDYSDLEYPVEE